jgi:hypothetical protein
VWSVRSHRRFGALIATCFHAGFLLGLFFDPEDGGDMIRRNFRLRYIPEDIALYMYHNPQNTKKRVILFNKQVK